MPFAIRNKSHILLKHRQGVFTIKKTIIILIAAILCFALVCGLVFFDVIDIPFISDLLESVGIVRNAEAPVGAVTPVPDAEEYYGSNSNILSRIDADKSDSVPSEAEAFRELTERGFGDRGITAPFSADGELYAEEMQISDSGSELHPMYQALFAAESGDLWTVYDINGCVIAYPVSYKLDTGSAAEIIVSEDEYITSYDGITNSFYVTEPEPSAVTVIRVDRVDAETLNGLTGERIGELIG